MLIWILILCAFEVGTSQFKFLLLSDFVVMAVFVAGRGTGHYGRTNDIREAAIRVSRRHDERADTHPAPRHEQLPALRGRRRSSLQSIYGDVTHPVC